MSFAYIELEVVRHTEKTNELHKRELIEKVVGDSALRLIQLCAHHDLDFTQCIEKSLAEMKVK